MSDTFSGGTPAGGYPSNASTPDAGLPQPGWIPAGPADATPAARFALTEPEVPPAPAGSALVTPSVEPPAARQPTIVPAPPHQPTIVPLATPPVAYPATYPPAAPQPAAPQPAMAQPAVPGTEYSGPIAYPTQPGAPGGPVGPASAPAGLPWGQSALAPAAKPKPSLDLTKLMAYLDFGIAGSALLALVLSFLSFYTMPYTARATLGFNAWISPMSTIGLILVTLGGAVVALLAWGAIAERRQAMVKLGALGGLGLGWLALLLSLFITAIPSTLRLFSIGRGVGAWLVFIFATLATGGAVFDFIRSRPKSAPKPIQPGQGAPGAPAGIPQAYGAMPAVSVWPPQPGAPVVPPLQPPPMPGVPPTPPQSAYPAYQPSAQPQSPYQPPVPPQTAYQPPTPI